MRTVSNDTPSSMSLYDETGARKDLTTEEWVDCLKAVEKAERQVRSLCMVLAYSGFRLSEALGLAVDHVDLAAGTVIFESLKETVQRYLSCCTRSPCPAGQLGYSSWY